MAGYLLLLLSCIYTVSKGIVEENSIWKQQMLGCHVSYLEVMLPETANVIASNLHYGEK